MRLARDHTRPCDRAGSHEGVGDMTFRRTSIQGLLALLLAAACASNATPTPGVTPSPTSVPTASPIPTASPSPAWHWKQVGTIGAGETPGAETINTAIGFDGGYVALVLGTAWYSLDGAGWEQIELGGPIDYCPGSNGAPLSAVRFTAAASDGTRVLLVGVEQTGPCYDAWSPSPTRALSWLSSDGRHWSRSLGPGVATDSDPVAVWPIAGGWEAAVHEGIWGFGSGESTIVWRWTDGLAWKATSFGVKVSHDWVHATASAAGDRLFTYRVGSRTVIMTSSDGDTWREIEGAIGKTAVITHILPPVPDGPSRWLVLALPPNTTAWLSSDLEHWDARVITLDRHVSAVVGTPDGYVDSVIPECQGVMCPDGPQSQYISPDGLTWTPLTPALEEVGLLVSGPAGVLAISGFDSGAIRTVWRLEP